MKNIVNFSILLFLLMLPIKLSSQGFLERVAKKASDKIEQKAEERAEKKIDEKIDEGLDSIESSMEDEEEKEKEISSESRSDRRMSALMKKMGVSGEPVPVADQYEFSSKMSMHFKNLDSQGNVQDEGDVVTYLSPEEKNFAYEFISGSPSNREGPQKGVFIMDYANGATIILSDEDGEKTGVVYGLKFFDEAIEDDDDLYEDEAGDDMDFENPNYKKTGRAKTIAGYKCEEYVFDNEEEMGSFWVTKEADWKARDTFSTIFRAGLYSHGIYKGMLMESESTDKETGEKSMMQVTEFDDDVSVHFKPGHYELTNLGSVDFNKMERSEEE